MKKRILQMSTYCSCGDAVRAHERPGLVDVGRVLLQGLDLVGRDVLDGEHRQPVRHLPRPIHPHQGPAPVHRMDHPQVSHSLSPKPLVQRLENPLVDPFCINDEI